MRRQGAAVISSASLAAQPIEHDLVDEYRLLIEPALLGGGKRMFLDAVEGELVTLRRRRIDFTAVDDCTRANIRYCRESGVSADGRVFTGGVLSITTRFPSS